MSNNYDTPVILDAGVGTAAVPGDYYGFGRAAGAAISNGPRLYAGTGSPNGVVIAPLGSIWLRTDAGTAQVWQATDAVGTWVQQGTLAGAVTLTAIDTTATAAFQWTMADNQAAAVSLGAAGALNMLVFDTNGGTEHLIVNAANGLWIADASELRYGTPGSDVVHSADGTNEVVTGTGDIVHADDFDSQYGTDSDMSLAYASAGNIVSFQGVNTTAAGASPATAGWQVLTGNRITNNAVVGNGSGPASLTTGATDCTNGGGTAGPSGAITFTTGASTSTAGTSGNSGVITATTGNSEDGNSGAISLITGNATAGAGNSGNVVLTTGTSAGGTRGVIDINAATISLATQATDFDIIDNSATALTISEAANNYLVISTANAAESITLGNNTTNQTTNLSTEAGPAVTNGADHGTRLVLVEEFQQRPQLAGSIANTNASKTWEIAGTAAADANATFDTGGGVTLATAAVANNQQIVIPNTTGADNSQSPWQGTSWSTSDQVIGKFNFKVVDIANTMLFAGFKITTTIDISTDDNQLFVGANSAGTLGGVAANFVVVESRATIDLQTDTTVAVAAASWRVVIAWQADRTARVYLNGVLRHTTAAFGAGITTMKPMMGIEVLGGGAGRSMTVQRITCSKVYA